MRKGLLPPAPPGIGPRAVFASVVLHSVTLGALVWVSTHTRTHVESPSLVQFHEVSDRPREYILLPPLPPERSVLPTSIRPAPVARPARTARGIAPPTALVPETTPTTPTARDGGRVRVGSVINGVTIVGTSRRIGPSYGDGTMWVDPDVDLPDDPDFFDPTAVIAQRLLEVLDSLPADSFASVGGLPQWVTDIAGQTWGIDQQFIHLGPLKIPTFLLGFLPLPQGNYELAQHEAWLNSVRQEILSQARRMEDMEDFRNAVRELRDRKDRERKERRARSGVVARDSIIPR